MHSSRTARSARQQAPGHRGLLVVAAVLILLLQGLVPYGHLVLYPMTLLSTWVHEMGHGVTALLCGGRFEELVLFADASGLARSAVPRGWREAATAAGGLLAPPLCGAIILRLARHAPRALLAVLAGALLLSLLLWVRTAVGWAAMAPLLLLCLGVLRWGGTGGCLFFMQLVGLLLALDTVARIGYLFVPAGMVGGIRRPSDVAGIAQVLGGSILVWGALLAGVSLALLLGGLVGALRAPRKELAPERG
ncbi:MAG: M50 family metallopeptidase [Myxococcales bacterium]|nr:M50 family metallopeptidase [Myxococcota bacterium]MDW8283395.1 M50 family metallopeptidase [Myxococcales bacterium]